MCESPEGSWCDLTTQQCHQSCTTTFALCLINWGKWTLPFYLCSGNMILGLWLEGRVRGEISLLENPALITACLLRGFHPRDWHKLQTRTMGEASETKSTFIPTLVNKKPWWEQLPCWWQQWGVWVGNPSLHCSCCLWSSLLLDWFVAGKHHRERATSRQKSFYFRSPWENLL